MPRIIIIAGDLASGKSTLAKQLSAHLRIPSFTKESLKELLGEQIDYKSRVENKRLSNSAINVLLHICERFAIVKQDVILEANFHKADLEIIKRECEFNQVKPVLLYLTGDIDVLFERFMYRTFYGNRHPVHLTHPLLNVNDFEKYVLKYRSEDEVLPRLMIDVTNCDRDVVFAKAIETLNKHK